MATANNNDSFFNDFLVRLPRMIAASPGWVINVGAADICKLSDYVTQLLLLQKAGLPATTGAGKTAAALAAAKLTPQEVGPLLLAELQERLSTTQVVGQGTDRQTGNSYVSISPIWWAHTHLDAAMLYIAE